MTAKEIEILDFVNENYDGPIDNKVNVVFNKYDIGLSKMNEVRNYLKSNMLDI
tara:strand:+ start:622 stop:780 length:159 start_codon:yes stop_codon:yes gene_type:complete